MATDRQPAKPEKQTLREIPASVYEAMRKRAREEQQKTKR